MTKNTLRGVAAAAALAIVATTGVALAQKKSKKEPVMWAATDLKWATPPGAPKEVQIASLWGAMEKGHYGVLGKFAAGSKHPLHTHSADLKIVVVSGGFLTGPEGGPEKTYGPGSYLMIPGNWKHTGGCAEGADCVFFQESDGKFDVKFIEAKK